MSQVEGARVVVSLPIAAPWNSARLHSEEEAVREALALWEEREGRRLEFLASLDQARASLARGEGRAITQESVLQLAADVKERGRRMPSELT
jgi:Arc/MetJ-type ribon-helix-helix transcriptional regulator